MVPKTRRIGEETVYKILYIIFYKLYLTTQGVYAQRLVALSENDLATHCFLQLQPVRISELLLHH